MIRTLSLLCAALSLWAAAALADCKIQKIADLPVTIENGDPLVEAKINGTTLRFVADSGAFFSLISPAVAARLRLKTFQAPGGLTIKGFGGEAETSVARPKDFEIPGITLHNIDFLVTGNGLGAEVDGLLGQNILGFADVEYDLANGMIRLWQPVGCGDSVLAYWLTKDQPFNQLSIRAVKQVHHTAGEAVINGHMITALFDTGAYKSYVSKSAAQRVGVDLAGKDVREADKMVGGIGLSTFRTVIAPVQSFAVGGEQIRNTHLRFGDADLLDYDMIIGADFFLSHRIYVSNTQRQMYFTYNGGPVFDISTRSAAAATPPSAKPATAAPTDAGLDASAFARRGDASAERGDYAAAIADLTRARTAAPDNADFAFDRARVYRQQGKVSLAMADTDDAIRLQPAHVRALMLRAALWGATSDKAHARTDIDTAARLAPPTSDAHLELAQMYLDLDAPGPAIGQFDLWLQTHPKDVGRIGALNGRCWARAILGQELTLALADCDTALRSGGKAAAALDSRGLVHLRLGQFDKAIADYDGALSIDSKLAWSLYGRGIAELRMSKTSQSKTDIAAAVAIDPKLPTTAKGYGVTP